MHTVGLVVQILAVVFFVLNLLTEPQDWRRNAFVFGAVGVWILLAALLHDDTARAIVLIGGFVTIFVGVRTYDRRYDARRPNRSRTRR